MDSSDNLAFLSSLNSSKKREAFAVKGKCYSAALFQFDREKSKAEKDCKIRITNTKTKTKAMIAAAENSVREMEAKVQKRGL